MTMLLSKPPPRYWPWYVRLALHPEDQGFGKAHPVGMGSLLLWDLEQRLARGQRPAELISSEEFSALESKMLKPPEYNYSLQRKHSLRIRFIAEVMN